MIEKILNGLVKALGYTVILSLSFIYFGLSNAFVINHFWLWFIIPIFHTSIITYTQAFGFSLIVSYLTKQHDFPESDNGKSTIEQIQEVIYLALTPWATFLVGWMFFKIFM